MLRLRSLLPSVHKLVVFEAAARHLSFTRAAAELGVTQSAVSNQIRDLEEYTGLSLFRRAHRRLELTPEGDLLYNSVSGSFTEIAQTLSELQARAGALCVSITAPFGMTSFWLTNLIPDLEAILKDTEIKILAADKCLDIEKEGVELGVRYGFGGWPGLVSELLFETAVFPVCSPAYLEEHADHFNLDSLDQLRLLRVDNRYYQHDGWEYWYQGMTGQPLENVRGPVMNSHTQTIMAAVQGKGVAIGSFPTEVEFLRSGTLVRPFPESVRGKRGYYLVYSERRPLGAQMKALIELLKASADNLKDEPVIANAIG